MSSRLSDALSNITEIHAHLAKSEIYAGVQAKPVLLSAFLGLTAACLQDRIIPSPDALQFVCFWITTAGICAGVAAIGAVIAYFFYDDHLGRRHARIVASQLAPSLAAGVFLVLALLPHLHQCIGLFPGLWAILYALGLFSVRPYMPRATGWVGLYFILTGTLLLNLLPMDQVPSPWSIAVIFAAGQAGLALVLYRNTARDLIRE
ncbi:MAG: hypothetical protein JNJ77_03775 [Planctomycetia bacterium]|nr:hypothetical protein [Planctomycetia bacterium]